MRPDFVGLGGFDSHALPPLFRRRLGPLLRLGGAVVALSVGARGMSAQQPDSLRPPRDTLRAKRDSLRSGVVDTTRRAAPPPASGTRSRAPAPRDTVRPPISPRRAFLSSALLPGYAQARLGRPSAGALFMAIEATSIAMATKAAYDLRYAHAHARDTVVTAYQVDARGVPVLDPTTGLPVPVTIAPNRYGGSRVKARRTHFEDWLAAIVFNHLFAGADAFVAAQLWDLPSHVSLRASPRSASIAASVPW